MSIKLNYIKVGDYNLPNLILDEPPELRSFHQQIRRPAARIPQRTPTCALDGTGQQRHDTNASARDRGRGGRAP